MKELKLPEQLAGPWEHALILTYGADIPFFENALSRQFNARCRNNIILADGQRYLEACLNYTQGGIVRHLNQQYVAEGIFTSHAAHAKLVLLTNAEQGRLLVGSGNLSQQGYASGGELFTRYEYQAKETDQAETLNAFLTVRELIERLLSLGYINSASARKRLNYLLEQTPWLYHSSTSPWQPVRHNFDQSFLSQLQQVVGSNPVQELWILSPFYDPEALALKQLLITLKPKQTTLLIQPGYTSLDPPALQGILDQYRGCRVRAFQPAGYTAYVHAKLYLLKLSKRAICLQGSPNLSQVAMLRSGSQGNLELANLLTGPPDSFDDLFQHLAIEAAAAPLHTLHLVYTPPDAPPQSLAHPWRLTSGEWQSDSLTLTFQGNLPNLQDAVLVIGSQTFTLEGHHRASGKLELKLPTEASVALDRAVPVRLRWGHGDDALVSNPIFICNRSALDRVIEVAPDGGEITSRLGDLDLEDEEFEQLLGELDAALMIDRRSVWQVAGRSLPTSSDTDDDEGLHLSYANIDYELLRRHPKIAQYLSRGTGGQPYLRSRLRIILSAITDHFNGLLDPAEVTELPREIMTAPEMSEAQTEEDRELEEAEQLRRRWSAAQRLQRILKNFIGRYLRGIRSPDFQELAGYEVMTQNYIIFSYLLWRLFSKEWVEPDFVVDSLLSTWTFFWGNSDQAGYFQGLTKAEQDQAFQLLQEHHTEAELLAALAHSAHVVYEEEEYWDEQRFAMLQDFWHTVLRQRPLAMTPKTVEETWRIMGSLTLYEPPRPNKIVEWLETLAKCETHHHFLRRLETEFGYPRHSCDFKDVYVKRASFKEKDKSLAICLVLQTQDILPDKNTAIALLHAWMRFENRDYYRIACPDHNNSRRTLFYDVATRSGIYYARDLDEEFELGDIVPPLLDWEIPLAQMKTWATQLDNNLTLVSTELTSVSKKET
ncbi:MAG: hypothetical protein BroJett011_18240 [Chloroflexota bacterium]|nr:MAG: hypothetical protein BroJett011_18240 [Chloroflexota bacterium]